MIIDENLVLFDIDVESKEDVIETLGSKLHKNGYVTDEFVKGAVAREQTYPTGLPTSPYGIAIPHTDADKVIEGQIAFANTKNPVAFQSMSDSTVTVDVNIVFMLALNKPEKQLKMLQKLMGLFQNETIVKQLGEVRDIQKLRYVIGF